MGESDKSNAYGSDICICGTYNSVVFRNSWFPIEHMIPVTSDILF